MCINCSLISANHPSVRVNQVLTEYKLYWDLPRNKSSLTELNQGLQRLSLKTDTSTNFSRVKPR